MSNVNQNGVKTGNASSLGVVLIGVGGLLALSNMGIIGGFGGVVGLIVLAGLGGWLLNQYYSGRRQLWLLLAGFILLGCGAATVTGSHAGAWFLGISGLGFLTAWRENQERWWALIPAGTLFTLAAVVVADTSWRWLNGGAVFFLGMAATFLALYMLPRHAQSWAIVPAVASAGLALLVWGASGSWMLPVLLILTGFYLVRGGKAQLPRFSVTWEATGQRQPDKSGGRSAPAAEEAHVSPAQLPEQITSTGPEIGEDWPEQNGSRSA